MSPCRRTTPQGARSLVDDLARRRFDRRHLKLRRICHRLLTHLGRTVPCEHHHRQRRWCWHHWWPHIGGTAGGGKIPCGRDVLVADVMAYVVGATTGPVGATGGPNSASFSRPAGPCTASNLSATALMFSCRRSIDSKS